MTEIFTDIILLISVHSPDARNYWLFWLRPGPQSSASKCRLIHLNRHDQPLAPIESFEL